MREPARKSLASRLSRILLTSSLMPPSPRAPWARTWSLALAMLLAIIGITVIGEFDERASAQRARAENREGQIRHQVTAASGGNWRPAIWQRLSGPQTASCSN